MIIARSDATRWAASCQCTFSCSLPVLTFLHLPCLTISPDFDAALPCARLTRQVTLFMLCYSVLHIATWAMVRYRLPVDAVLLPFAALGVMDLARRVRTAAVRRPD